MRHSLTVLALALAPAASGCAAAVMGVGAGVVISNEVTENQGHVAHIAQDAARVWVVAKSTLSHMAAKPIDVDEDLRRIIAEVEGATVTVNVAVFDLNRTQMRVQARRLGVIQTEVADMVMRRLISRLEE